MAESSAEHRLVLSAQRGDRLAFAQLVKQYWERLFRWLYQLTHHRQTAEDLAQETFLKALKAIDSFQPGTNFQAWLFRIAHNAWLNVQRSLVRQREPLPEMLPGADPGPVELSMTHELQQQLTQAIRRLPTELRAAFLLRTEQDLSFREVADVLGLTEETARWRVFKARQQLLTVLQPPTPSHKR